ncbi:Asp-tRNA(Asn)/Glu-tRNA(Gln) amidotransferase subunit GatB [Candidatus Latescibacterota bacterium]
MRYIPTIGLEIHSQLASKTKIFCGCSTEFGGESNTHGCPVCLGMPGVLPVLNEQVVKLAMRLALRTGSEIQPKSYFARKNYFYPDLPKGYQISMLEYPLICGGGLTVDTPNGEKFIRLNRIHLEEDAGKLIHEEGNSESYFDVNRCGVPLVEIVTEPDFETTEEITQFLTKLKEILIFSGVSNGNMEEGNIRVDANTSIRPETQKELGTRSEIKNLNSFANVVSAVNLEIDRQTDIVESGGKVILETLLYDSVKETLTSMRSKEESHDYRYFPEPDLVPLIVNDEMIEQIRNELPELRGEIMERFENEYGLPDYDAGILTSTPSIAMYFEETVKAGANPKKASNWVMGDVLRILNETRIDIRAFKVRPSMLASLIQMIDKGTISGSIGKTVFDEMASEGTEPEKIVEQKGLSQISDKGELEKIAAEIIESYPDETAKYRSGKKQLLSFFVGQVMKATRGKANPNEVSAIFQEFLS